MHTNAFTVTPSNLDLTGRKTLFGLTIVSDRLCIRYGAWSEGTFKIYYITIAVPLILRQKIALSIILTTLLLPG